MEIFIRHDSKMVLCYVEYCTYKYFIVLLLFDELLSCFVVMHGIMPHTFQQHSKYNLVKNVIRVSNGSYKRYFFKTVCSNGLFGFSECFPTFGLINKFRLHFKVISCSEHQHSQPVF